jgi:hypothetical protein
LEKPAIRRLGLRGAFRSFKAVIEQNHAFAQMPEMFCFGPLEAFDLEQLMALAASKPVTCAVAETSRKTALPQSR